MEALFDDLSEGVVKDELEVFARPRREAEKLVEESVIPEILRNIKETTQYISN